MRLLLFSDFAPTEENYNGPSAFCYHLLKELQKEHDVRIVTTNANKVPDRILQNSIKAFCGNYFVHPRNLWMKLLVSRKTGMFFSIFYNKHLPYISRYIISKKVLCNINRFSPDVILIYPNHLLYVCKQLSNYRIISLGPDCSSLNNLRALKDTYIYDSNNYRAWLKSLSKQIYLERELSKVVYKTCLVGIEDSILFNIITGTRKSIFLPHPHYKLVDKNINFQKPQLKILISGTYNISTYSDTNKFIESFLENPEILNKYSLTFLGKGWDEIMPKLSNLNNVNVIKWVDDYAEEIKKYDIQIFPISYGVGTKGKVLDALAMGLLCIGSYYAFENISVKNGENCIIYNEVHDVIKILETIGSNVNKYEIITVLGKQSVRRYHSPKLCAEYLMNVIKGKNINVSDVYYSEKKI